ncbi:MAG: hypothetical protein KF864_02740 [Phycisphaeraceae bacterium]|nr:hypothetical protein [Phycisphaeraceae bacterium]MBX3410467.1 hypothetical protein [Phycisphaeraceae bacterium]
MNPIGFAAAKPAGISSPATAAARRAQENIDLCERMVQPLRLRTELNMKLLFPSKQTDSPPWCTCGLAHHLPRES